MTAELAWELILSQLMVETREFKTVPSNKRAPVWFYAEISNNEIIVGKAFKHTPHCKLNNIRKITYKDFSNIFSYFLEWRNDSSIRKKIKLQSGNIAYIFALIADICENKMSNSQLSRNN